MKGHRIALALFLTVAVVGCSGGNHSADTEAPVFLSANITQGPADVDISVPADVAISAMTINSSAKSTAATLSAQQDVMLSEWVITPQRSDGGSVASPQWRNFYEVYVPAGGSATVNNYRIFPAEFFKQKPLAQLFPENGGFDPETGRSNIRQRLRIAVYGKTIAGDSVVLDFDVNLNFFYQTP